MTELDQTDGPRFQVVLSGSLTGDFDKATTSLNLQKKFHISRTDAEKMLGDNDEHVVKVDLHEDIAIAMLTHLIQAGCGAFMQEMTVAGATAYDEKRSSTERRQRYRRDPRPGAIMPDRRIQARRSVEIQQLMKILRDGKKLPLHLRSYTMHT
jgi:hypothetical protein